MCEWAHSDHIPAERGRRYVSHGAREAINLGRGKINTVSDLGGIIHVTETNVS